MRKFHLAAFLFTASSFSHHPVWAEDENHQSAGIPTADAKLIRNMLEQFTPQQIKTIMQEIQKIHELSTPTAQSVQNVQHVQSAITQPSNAIVTDVAKTVDNVANTQITQNAKKKSWKNITQKITKYASDFGAIFTKNILLKLLDGHGWTEALQASVKTALSTI